MAFEIGERVTSRFTGPGTVIGEMTKDEDRECFQTVRFDSAMFGERSYSIKKLEPLRPEDEPVKIIIKVSQAEQDYAAAKAEGLTHFEMVAFDRDEPNLEGSAFKWLCIYLSERGSRITVYATPKNVAKVAAELAEITGLDLDQAMDLISLRDRKTPGGSKWNVDFANDPSIHASLRDDLRVNFGHTYSKKTPDIRRIRIGSTKLVQALIKAGFLVTRVYEQDGETRKNADRGRDVKIS